MNSRLTTYSVSILTIYMLLAPLDSALANPSNAKPRDVMPILLTSLNQDTFNDAKQRYGEAARLVEKMLQVQRSRGVGAIPADDFVKCYTHLFYLKFDAQKLEWTGEATGFDLSRRHYHLEKNYLTLIQAYRNTPQFQPVLQRVSASTAKYNRVLDREEKRIEGLLAEMKADEAWQVVQKTMLEMMPEPLALLPQTPVRMNLIGRYDADEKAAAIWKSRGDEALQKRRDAALPDYDGILKQLGDAGREMQASGQTKWQGQPITGPNAIRQAHQLWQAAHVSALRACYLEYARIPLDPKARNSLLKMRENYAGFCDKFTQRLAAIVQADATAAPSAEVANRHQAYVTAFAPLYDELADEALREPLRKAVAMFALKSPELADSLSAYENATAEHLRWMKRVVAAKAQAAAKDTLPIADQLQSQTAIYHPRHPDVAELRDDTVTLMQKIAPLIVGKEGLVSGGGAKATPGAKSVIGRYDRRIYCIVGDPAEWLAPHQQQLAESLYISEQHPPRSLPAAAALASLAHCHFTTAGGKVTACHIEAVATRLGTLPPAAHPFLRLGPFDAEPKGEFHELKQLLVRCDVTPTWIATPYVFVTAP